MSAARSAPRDRDGPPQASWYRAVEAALDRARRATGRIRRSGAARCAIGDARSRRPRPPPKPAARDGLLPDWLRRPAPAEERPPRPLAPSAIGEDDVADPPPGPDQRAGGAARPAAPPIVRAAARRRAGASARALAARWLERSAGVADAGRCARRWPTTPARIIDDPPLRRAVRRRTRLPRRRSRR